MRRLIACCLGICVMLFASSMAYASEWSYERQEFPRPSEYPVDMMGEDPDWSGYTIEEFQEIDFSNFADNTVPESSLNEEQLSYLETNHANVIYRLPVKQDVLEIFQSVKVDDDSCDLLVLTRHMFEEEGITFRVFKLV